VSPTARKKASVAAESTPARSLEEVLGVLEAGGLLRRVTSLQVGEVHVTLKEEPEPEARRAPRGRLSNLPKDEEDEVVAQENEEDAKKSRMERARDLVFPRFT
jgi:hypothetical protein